MSITQNRVKVRNYPVGQERNFISYFQSVTTVGIVNRAKNIKEASQLASQKLSESGFTCGVISQTPMQLSATEEWKPDLSAFPFMAAEASHLKSLAVDFNQHTRIRIATKLGKKPEELTDEDCVDFIKSSVDNSLNGHPASA